MHKFLDNPLYCMHNVKMRAALSFEWDQAKNAANQAKHGCFFDMVKDFDFSTALMASDNRFAYDEACTIAIGMIGVRLHVLVFTPRGVCDRVISLRKANKRERQRYEKVR